MKYIRALIIYPLMILSLVVTGLLALPRQVNAAYDGAHLVDNQVFLNTNAMNASQIQSFLANRGGGLANRSFQLNCYASDSKERQWYTAVGAPCDQTVPASHIIYYASRIYGINPQIILATIQKEQSLVTSPNPTDWQINQAMGYGCPTTGGCGASNFFYQIDNGTWVLRYHYERANRNYTWWNNNTNWTCGTEKNFYKPSLHPNQNVHFYDGNGVHYRTHFLANAATSSMYCYTPHAYNNPQGLYGHPAFGTTGQYYSGSYNFVRFFEQWFGSTRATTPIISYKSHVKTSGWTNTTNYSGMTGSTGLNRPMEAFKINGLVEYTSYNHNSGWQPIINRGMISGTTGQSRPIQAIKINPISSLASQYDIYYRVHVSNVGWMGWAKNGAIAGVTGGSTRNIEAIEVQPMPKGSMEPGSTSGAHINNGTVNPTPVVALNTAAHVSTIGWQPTVIDTMTSGTTEQAKSMEAMRIALVNNSGFEGDVVYSSHLSNIGWQSLKSNNQTSGTTGQARRMEAVRIALTGSLGDNYDVWYRGHVQSKGWLGWAKNGEPAGSVGANLGLEAVEIRLAPKNSISLPTGGLHNPNRVQVPDTYSLSYSAHVRDIGWMSKVSQGATAGTTGRSKPVESLRIDSITSMLGSININCTAYVKGTGWNSSVTSGNTCGTTGRASPLEALQFSLSGPAASKYNIQYRVHLSQLGWQGWVTNGANAGTPDSGRNIEAVNIRLVAK